MRFSSFEGRNAWALSREPVLSPASTKAHGNLLELARDSGILIVFPRGEREWIALRAASEVGLQGGRWLGVMRFMPLGAKRPYLSCSERALAGSSNRPV